MNLLPMYGHDQEVLRTKEATERLVDNMVDGLKDSKRPTVTVN